MAECNASDDYVLPESQKFERGSVSGDGVYVPHSKQSGRYGRGRSFQNYHCGRSQTHNQEISDNTGLRQQAPSNRYSGSRRHGQHGRHNGRQDLPQAAIARPQLNENAEVLAGSSKSYSLSSIADRSAACYASTDVSGVSNGMHQTFSDSAEFEVTASYSRENVTNSRVKSKPHDDRRDEERSQRRGQQFSRRGQRSYGRSRGQRGAFNSVGNERFAAADSHSGSADRMKASAEFEPFDEANPSGMMEFTSKNFGSKTHFSRSSKCGSERSVPHSEKYSGQRPAAAVCFDADYVPEEHRFHDLQISTELTNSRDCEPTKTTRKPVFDAKMKKTDPEFETQRGLLIEQLTKGSYECMICYNVVKREAAIWSCSNCYHSYHLYCIKRWANSSMLNAEGGTAGWRCPACQNATTVFPNAYMCFCGKVKDPEYQQYTTPHSCGEVCGRERGKNCPHRCNILCHPGPCPPCLAFSNRSCLCGKTRQMVKCALSAPTRCDKVCEKTRNCGKHACQSVCHEGSCDPCSENVTQTCFCAKETRVVLCGSQESFDTKFPCGSVCGRNLDCRQHQCEQLCHAGVCDHCSLQPGSVTHCPCGKTALVDIPGAKPRRKCTDAIATCQLTCMKPLPCGTAEVPHECKRKCHTGACGPCGGVSAVDCRCGSQTTELPCSEVVAIKSRDCSEPLFRCDRRCNKKMSCGRHKCGQYCCVNADHQCRLVCGYKLSCGNHTCEETCHRGKCPPCWHVSFDELRCECGAEVIYPPVPCGTEPPPCSRPCTRARQCGHEVLHTCHSEPTCPPCPVLTQKWCHGRHELRSHIPCYVAEISCGLACNRPLPCAIHKCIQTCHKGDCPPCSQPCPSPRVDCGHPCMAPCHSGSPCPSTACKTEITVHCECGRREERVLCMQGASGGSKEAEYSKAAAQAVASRLWEQQSIDISVLKKELKNRRLVCNADCAIMERNQRLALALEIKNPDLSAKLGNPAYSQFLKDHARQNPTFVAGVEKALSDVVTATMQPKVNRKVHSFKSMPNAQRRVIHELAEFYGCQTESYDEEPNKNVVATAIRNRCWLPNVTLTALVQRELFPKAPMPIPITSKEAELKSAAKAAKHSTQVYSDPKPASSASAAAKPKRSNQTYVDYFEMID